MMLKHATALALCAPLLGYAQIAPDSPMVQALREGHASVPAPDSRGAQTIIQKIQAHTGSRGDVTVEFSRVSRFTFQPQCGRVSYGLYQKSSNTFFAQFGGQLNICEDGSPPMRQCRGMATLVVATATCPDGGQPTDTDEVRAAMQHANAQGSMTFEQFGPRYQAALKKRLERK